MLLSGTQHTSHGVVRVSILSLSFIGFSPILALFIYVAVVGGTFFELLFQDANKAQVLKETAWFNSSPLPLSHSLWWHLRICACRLPQEPWSAFWFLQESFYVHPQKFSKQLGTFLGYLPTYVLRRLVKTTTKKQHNNQPGDRNGGGSPAKCRRLCRTHTSTPSVWFCCVALVRNQIVCRLMSLDTAGPQIFEFPTNDIV